MAGSVSMSAEEKFSAAAQAPVSSLATAMLFGTITFATVALATRTWLIGDSRAITAAMGPRAKPLDTNSFTSIYTLLHHFTVLGLILFFAYICENHPIYPHDEKVYDRDQFFFMILLLFVCSLHTVHKNDSANTTPTAFGKKRINTSNGMGPGVGQGPSPSSTSMASSSSSKLGDKLQAISNKSKSNINNGQMPPNRNPNHNNMMDDATFSSFNTGTVQTHGTFIHAVATEPCNDVLNRDQTEEWKGWMQFIFLIYHYYHAEEVYNSIRIMITCYVWMTGFGNFSFFYLKNDYSYVRLVQMLWRLNFLVVFLCLSQGTTYILYYICPLHTYFFLMVYATMGLGRKLNYSKYGLRLKLSALALLIFFMWDVDSGLFRMLHFPFFGKEPVLGAKNGALWEWYFRTSLDHWSTFLGMIFAANFPITSLFYRKLEALPPIKCWLAKCAIGLPLLASFMAWARGPFMLEKFDYNMTNAYFGFLPVITYIYFRNLTPTLRSYSLKVLHEIGKTTLETYLMQHHIWLTSNAKSLLVLVPGWPKVNMMLVTIIYFYTSRRLYKLTLFLRGMLLPNDAKKCTRSLTVMGMCIFVFYVVAVYLRFLEHATLKAVAIVSIVCGALLYQTIMDTTWSMYASAESSDELSFAESILSGNIGADSYVAKSFPPVIGGMVIVIIGIAWQGMVIAGAGKIGTLHEGCQAIVNRGHWIPVDGCNEAARGMAYRNDHIQNFATCSPAGAGYTWGWETATSSTHCRFTQRTEKQLKEKLTRRRLVFVGDSMTRNLYHAVSRSLGIVEAGLYDAGGPKHVDISRTTEKIDLDFKWNPMASEQLGAMKELNENAKKQDASTYDLIVIGGGAWDRLHKFSTAEEIAAHSALISGLVDEINAIQELGIKVVWMTPTTINNPALNTPEKRDHMTEEDMSDMRSKYEQIGVNKAASLVLNGPSFTRERVSESYDGVHYPQDVYDAGAQILANAYDWLLPEITVAEKFTAPEAGKMARPFLGCMMLCLCFIGLFFFDGFFGFSYLACLFIKGLLPSDLYLEAFSILHEKYQLPPLTFGSGGSVMSQNTVKTKNTSATKSRVSAIGKNRNKGRQRRTEPAAVSGIDEEIAALLNDDMNIEMKRANI